jgi:hypothetical protein
MTWWRRICLCCLPWLVLGCRVWPLRPEAPPTEARVAQELEAASVRVWSEDRPLFHGIRPEVAARAWERNLRVLELKPQRSGGIVECQTPEGCGFSLNFISDKRGNSQGEMLWHKPDDAGRGMTSLIELEKKHRVPFGFRNRNNDRPAEVVGLLPAGTLFPDLNL